MRASKNKQHFLLENEELRTRLEEAEETLRAIRAGEVDALVVSGPEGDQLYTLKGADYSYRILLETMEEGAATLAGDGAGPEERRQPHPRDPQRFGERGGPAAKQGSSGCVRHHRAQADGGRTS